MKAKIFSAAAVAAVLLLAASACSSEETANTPERAEPPVTSAETAAPSGTAPAVSTSAPDTATDGTETGSGEASVAVKFVAANGTGTVTVSGEDSPIAAWFANQPGEISLDLADADIEDPASVVEELVSFWFFRDDSSGDIPPRIYASADGAITDTKGTVYVVEAQPLPAAPGVAAEAETGETEAPAASAERTETETTVTSTIPETATTVPAAETTVPEPEIEPPELLQVQVLNGSGKTGAAGQITAKLSDAGYVVLPAGDAERRYSTSAVYYQRGHAGAAAEILAASGIEAIEAPEPMPPSLAAANAPAVIVLLGEDTAPAAAAEQADLRPQPRSDVSLPLPASVPRDSYVPGLANIQIFTEANENSDNETVTRTLADITSRLNVIGRYAAPGARLLAVPRSEGQDYEFLLTQYEGLEIDLRNLGFTPQNVCGAPAGYSFTDLLKPVREWNEQIQTYSGDAIFTTDRLLELHGGQRINPEGNLDFYINQAVQTAHDHLRLAELLDETEAPQLILCWAWLAPSGEVPEFANGAYYTLLTPGIQPRESLLSQGDYHVKEISRNGNIASVVVCHPTLGERYLMLHWRDGGYRAELVTSDLVENTSGCQAVYEVETYIYEDTSGGEDTFRFGFGERVFSASDLQAFPKGGIR